MFFRWKSTIPDNNFNVSTPYYHRDQKLNGQTSETFWILKKTLSILSSERGENCVQSPSVKLHSTVSVSETGP